MTTKIKLNQVYPIPASASNSELTGTPTAPTPSTSDDSNKIATTAYVKSNLSNYLPISGGTLTGNLYGSPAYNNSLVEGWNADDTKRMFICKDPVYIKGDPVTDNRWFTIGMAVDSSGDYGNAHKFGQIEVAVSTDGSCSTGLYAYKNETNSTASSTIRVGYNSSGNVYTQAPTPATTDNSTQIATTAYVKACVPKSVGSATQPVYTDSNGVVTVGTYELNKTVPSNAVFTDANVTATKITYPSSSTNYYPVASNADATGTAGLYKFGADIRYQVKAGTTSAEGQAELVLGNSTASGTAGNTTGDICLYNNSGKYSVIKGHSGDTTNRTNYLPKASGTLVCHTTDTAIGDANTPVYVDANGVVTSTGKSFANYVTTSGDQTIAGNKTFSGTTCTFSGTSTFSGQVILSKKSTFSDQVVISKNTAGSGTAANAVALIVGGVQTAAHLELDPNSIMAKSNGTTLTTLYLQDGNACLYSTTATFAPNVTNVLTLGASGKVWKQLYAGTTTISTSDERQKQQIEDIPDEVLDAWEEVEFKQFKFNDSVEEKGSENARIHMGLIAQRIKEVFEKHNLDPFKYGFFCYDEWDVHEDPKDENSPVIRRENGYALRYEEALIIEAAYQRRRFDRIEAKLKELELK